MKSLLNFIILAILILFYIPATAQQPSCAGEQGKVKWYYYEGINGSRVDYLYQGSQFPQAPNGFVELTSLQSPLNYNDYYGSMVKGYIKAPTTGQYTFNATGSDRVNFFLSTTTEPSDTQFIIETSRSIYSIDNYYAYPDMTSAPINLVQDQYYYFEVHHKENDGRDYFNLSWKVPNAADTSFQTIPNEVLYNYDCFTTCPVMGTSCDDGDPNTVDDMEDGACNCFGTPTNTDSCVGKRGEVLALYWMGIPGEDVYDLQSDPDYPYKPDMVEMLTSLSGPKMEADSFGSRVRSILIVPVTGTYTFNVTGDDETWLYLSTSPSFELASVIAEVPNWTRPYEHNKYISQTSEPVQLMAGQLYYLEINHKDGRGGESFGAFWKTPFNIDDKWKLIDGVYLFDYTCDQACLPQGTPCDDEDNSTYNDQYDGNCNCVGTPCQSGDCDAQGNLIEFTPYEECAPTDKHTNDPTASWLSCAIAGSPNPARGSGHWIQYDFGRVEKLTTTQVWNYNAMGETGKGFRDVVVDYSTDGSTWIELGQYTWAEASGQTGYTGFNGPDFAGTEARYVLITALNNWSGDACMGFSKINFSTDFCPSTNTACTIQESGAAGIYDSQCTCRSLDVPFNECIYENSVLTPAISTGNYSASQTIVSASTIPNTSTVNFVAGQSITLEAGFTAPNGCNFHALILDCNGNSPNSAVTEEPIVLEIEDKAPIQRATLDEIAPSELLIYPTPTNTWTTINFNLPTDEEVHLSIRTTDGQLVRTIINNQPYKSGTHQKLFPAQTMSKGMYFVVLRTSKTVLTKSLVVMDTV